MAFQGDLNAAFEVLIFLKRMKGHRKHVKGRLINIAIISMQIISMLALYCSLMVNMGQEFKLGLIIKTFVGLMLLNGIDNRFVNVLPKELVKNFNILNKSGLLIMTEDNNTTKGLLKRQFNKDNRWKCCDWPGTFWNICINLWVTILETL